MFDRDLNEIECSFVGNVVKDISQYMKLITMARDIPTILLLPPLNNHMRFLVHTLIQKVYVDENLFSISLGKFEARRVAIFPNVLKKCDIYVAEGKTELEDNTEKRCESAVRSINTNRIREGRNRKPDLQVYVPRAKRSNEETRQLKRKNDEDINLIEQLSKKKEEYKELTNGGRIEEISRASINNGSLDDIQEEVDLPSDSSGSESFLLSDGMSDGVQRCDEDGFDVHGNDIFSYDFEFIDPSIIDELTSTVGKVAITYAKEDYRRFQSELERNSEGHFIVEIYNFPAALKTRDLLSIFQAFKDFRLSWVDDTHALGIFSSPAVADLVLRTEFPLVKTRPLKEAIAGSRLKAKNFMILPAVRPKTCTAAARRLVSSALGVKIAVKPSVRAAEIKMLLEAREEKKRISKLKKERNNSCDDNAKSI